MRFGRQFSLKHLLLLMVAFAIAIPAYQRFIYVHPAHRANSLYEKAPPITGGRVKIGDCELSIRSVARTDRDGTILVEDGFGVKVATTVDNTKVLKQSAAWLDTAQIEFDVVGGQVDLHGIRVFDHDSRTLIEEINGARGTRRVDEDTLHFYGLGNRLPDVVDVFLRVRCYESSSKPIKLATYEGASCKTPHGVVRIDRIMRGMSSYSSESGFTTSPEREKENTFILLEFAGESWTNDANYEIRLVTKRNERILNDFYFGFPGSYVMPDGTRRAGIHCYWNLDDIEHFEIRPLGVYKKFFFDGLQMPQTSNAKFQTPPSPVLQVNGEEKDFKVAELMPLNVSLSFERGDVVNGTSSSGRNTHFSYHADPANVDTETTLIARVNGIKEIGWDLQLTPATRNFGAHTSSGSGRWMGAFNYHMPLENVKQLKIQWPPP